jgi:hypothetical protein
MATLATLIARGVLQQIDVPLDGELPMRMFCARPRFVDWLMESLPAEPVDRGGSQSPAEQIDDLLYRFISGKSLLDNYDLHALLPDDRCVWELKTSDVRIFGWFPERDTFVGVGGDMARRIKDMKLYGGYRDEVRIFRDRLDLDEPKYLQGSKVSDVLSV